MEENQTAKPLSQGSRDPLPIRSNKRRYVIVLVIVVIFLIAAGIGAYLWRDIQANTQHANDTAQINTLRSKNTKLETDLRTATGKTPGTTSTVPIAPPRSTTRASITDAIKSGNTAALESYMAPTVSVIVAASEGIGDRTPAEAVSDLSYISAATSPWNFSLDAATLGSYAAGDYKAYFLTDSLVGKSADGYVISFNFNSSGKISGIFMAAQENLLL